ncbi:MAG: glycosyltransferase [Flavobacterium sp.]|nr:MAG: glycosyltransferase [Flavobacterium sp.]
MNILFILPEYYPHSGGGISSYYIQYLKELKKSISRLKVIVGSGYTQSENNYSIDGIEIDYLKPDLFKKHLIKFSRFSISPEYQRNIAAAWAMWEQCEGGKGFDIVECVDFGLGFVPWVSKRNLPVITRLHGSTGQIELNEPSLRESLNGDLHRQTEYILLNLSNGIITHSKANQKYWNDILTNKKIDLIYPVYQSDQQKFSLNFDKKNTGIVCGRIQEWKGPDILCEAINLIQNKNVLINWFGRDTNFNGLLTKGEQLKQKYPKVWGRQIISNSPVANDQLMQVQRKAGFAIIPSTWDMFNFTGLEYMNSGIPVICSDGAGVSELVEDGVNGFKYQKYDYQALADCIEKVIDLTLDDYKKIVENARSTFLSKLAPDEALKENIKIYQRVLLDFKPSKSNSFIDALYYPDSMPHTIDNVLDKQSLKTLLKYIYRRLLLKIYTR